MYNTLSEIVEQLEYCNYQTKDGLHDLKDNLAFTNLKKMAQQQVSVVPEVIVNAEDWVKLRLIENTKLNNMNKDNLKHEKQCVIHDVIHSFIYGMTLAQKRRELCVMFGEDAVNIAELSTSRYVGALTAKRLFSKHFEATCYAAKNCV